LIYWSVFSVPYILIFLVLFTGTFFPSYTVRPAHYEDLRQRATTTGRVNIHNEKIFITASLSEKKGDLTSGAWGREVLQLVDLLGPENVHLSIYEDNPDLVTKQSLIAFRNEVKCETLLYTSSPTASLTNQATRPSSPKTSTSPPSLTLSYRPEKNASRESNSWLKCATEPWPPSTRVVSSSINSCT
jgi:ZIP family zinc transporter